MPGLLKLLNFYSINYHMKKLKVLSLFDWISAWQFVLSKLWYDFEYYASEIDKYAISNTQRNFPSTKQLWSVVDVKWSDLPKIDLLIGWSPCTWFSIAGKGLNFDDPQSKLFFEYIRLLNETKPQYFFLENVKMKKEWEDMITSIIWVEPILLDSADFSAWTRKRTYWTNIPYEKSDFIIDCTSNTNDIIEIGCDLHPFTRWHLESVLRKEYDCWKIAIENDIYTIEGIKYKFIEEQFIRIDWQAFVLPCLTPKRIDKRQNWRRFKPDKSKYYTLTSQDRHWLIVDWHLRMLSPVEAERLQWFPDNYTDWTYSKRMFALWNSWQTDTIMKFFKNIDKGSS